MTEDKKGWRTRVSQKKYIVGERAEDLSEYGHLLAQRVYSTTGTSRGSGTPGWKTR
jgi:hypothetical protein